MTIDQAQEVATIVQVQRYPKDIRNESNVKFKVNSADFSKKTLSPQQCRNFKSTNFDSRLRYSKRSTLCLDVEKNQECLVRSANTTHSIINVRANEEDEQSATHICKTRVKSVFISSAQTFNAYAKPVMTPVSRVLNAPGHFAAF